MIHDDGIGLSKQPILESTHDKSTDSFGLVGIRERVSLMRGDVSFETPERGGTQIKVVIPK